MKLNHILISLCFSLSMCGLKSEHNSAKPISNQVQLSQGVLYVNISKIYRDGGEVLIISTKGDTVVYLHDKTISISSGQFDLKKDEYKYSKDISIKDFYPEYGLFVLNCIENNDNSYIVEINSIVGKISKLSTKGLVIFKKLEQYVLEEYPIPTADNPLRISPKDDADIVDYKESLTFKSVKVDGDWLLIEDDKDCYSGATPSKEKITGWIRWRLDGKLILKIAYFC